MTPLDARWDPGSATGSLSDSPQIHEVLGLFVRQDNSASLKGPLRGLKEEDRTHRLCWPSTWNVIRILKKIVFTKKIQPSYD